MKKFLCAFLSILMIISVFPLAITAESGASAVPSNSVADGEYGLRTETVRENYALARESAGEGMVLLENNGALPLDDGEAVTLFGVGQYNFVEGGTGSGASFTAYKPDLVDSMKAAEKAGRIVLNTTLLDMYYSYYSANLAAAGINQYHAANQQAVNMEDIALTEDEVLAARAVSDTAIYTISRIQGEGGDRSAVKGDYYISDIEAENLRLINDAGFEKFIIILNTSIAIDTSFIKDYTDIDAVLMAWLPGVEGAYAVVDILLGDVNPSGKLTDTFAKSYDDYPSAESFLESNSYVNYSEDIFNGYRYFETFDPEYTKVNYEFGYGLSYTTFEIYGDSVTNDGEKITVEATVENTGSVAGKEVVQVYFSAPQGKLGKAARELIAYDKTSLLAPGESETLTMTFDIADMSAFDDLGKTGNKSAYVLEAGDYNIYIGNSVKNAGIRGIKGTYNVPELVVVEQLTSLATPTQLEQRLLADGTWEKLQTAETGDDGSYKIDTTAKLTVVEAENAQRYDDGITTEILFGGEQDNLKYLTGMTTGKSVEFDVTPDKADIVSLILAVSNPSENEVKPFSVYLNGTEVDVLADINNTCAEGEHVYTEVTYAALELVDGMNTVKLTSNTDSNLELDYIVFRPTGAQVIDGESTVVIEAENFYNISDGYAGNFEDASNGSKNLSSFNNGKWTEYILLVPEAGTYTLVLSYAANGNFTSPFTFSANGETLSVGSYTLLKTSPSNASTTTEIYNTVAESKKFKLDLPAGFVTFRVTASGTNAPNLDALIFKPNGVKINRDEDIRIEAEDYDNTMDGYTPKLEDATNGSKNIGAFNNKWTEYDLILPKAGVYKVVLSYAANQNFTSPFTFSANGEALSLNYSLTKTSPEGTTNTDNAYWNTVAESDPIAMTLPAGKVTLRVTGASSVPQFDALIFKAAGFEISLDSDTRIEAEHYDNTMDGYTPKLEDATNGSKNIGAFNNKWTEYDLILPEAGVYNVVLSYAANQNFTSPFTFSVNGETLSVDSYTLAKTSPEGTTNTDNAYWNTVAESDPIAMTLPAGKVTLRVTGAYSVPQFDALIFKASAVKISLYEDTRIEAEDYNNTMDGYTPKLEDATNGSKNIGAFNNKWTEYNLILPTEGVYKVVLSYAANQNFTSPFTFSVNGEALSLNYSLAKTSPEGTTNTDNAYWNTVAESDPIAMTLPAGKVTLRVTGASSVPNFDAIIFKASGVEISRDEDIRIEAEDYDNTMDGYTPKLEDATNGSKNIGAFNNKWTEYDLILPKAGVYKVVLSYAANQNFTSPFTFSANGETLSVNSYTLTKTSPEGTTNTDNAYWNTVAESDPIAMTLPAGKVTLRVTGAYSVPQFDALIFKASGFEISLDEDTRIEAEDYDNTMDGYTPKLEDATNGSKNIGAFNNKWTEYDLILPEAGVYNVVLSYAANQNFTSPFTFSVNGETLSVDSYTLAKTSPEGTTNTDNAYWNTVAESDPIAMTLPAGKVTLRVTGAYSVPQFDALIFKAAGFEISLDSDLSYAESEAPLSFIDVYNGDITMDEFLESMTNIDLIKLAGGSAGAVSRSAASFGRLVEYEIPQVTVSDGGAGLRLEPDIGATCLPCATLLACTWNTELIREMGRVAGRDGMSTNSDGWLAPGMNIHRNPLCGRNFEYYSEDPLVTGISAAMVILGAKDEGVNAVPKHFALNNKENGRTVSDSRISERAMREIYLEGYRIMFEMTDHKYLMSSYNKINGVEVAENYDILTGILRDEWGFDGIVMTDWANDSNNLKEVKAGNNLKMPKGDINAFVDALSDGSITRSDLKLNAKSILNAVLASNSMANAANYTKVSAEKSVVIHAKDFNFIQDNHTGINANGYYVQAQSWNFIVNTMDKTDVYAPLTSDIESDGVDYPDTSIFADYYIEVLDDGEYALDLLVCNDYSTGVVDVELDGELVGSVETKESDIARTHTETLVLALEAGKHKIRLSRNDASASDPVKLNRVVVSPYLGAELEAQAYINGNITVVDSTGVECEYPCNCSASITLLEGGSAKAVIREYDAIPVSTENGNTVLNYSLGVPAGTYTVRVEKPGYTAAECEITVSDGVDLATVPMLTLKREDCTSGVTCTECGRGSTAADDHSFEFVYNNDYHYLECAHCSAVSGEKSAHEPDENGKCTVCTYDASNADNAIFSVNVSTNGNGMVSYDDTDPAESFTAEVEASSNITLTAVTNEGFPFKGWYIKNGAKISDNLSITFAVLGDISLEAKFAPSYVIFTPETGLSGNNARNNHVIATKVSARGTLPSYINFNVPAAETAEDLSRFEIELDTNYYPEGYSSSTYPYMKICYRTSEYTSSEEINIATPSGARAWGGENFALNNNGSFNTVVYDLAKTSTGEDNWSDGNDSLIKEAPIFANNFTENKLSQIILRAAGKQGSTLTIGDLDIAYVAFFASKTEAEEFEIPRDVIYGDVNNDGSVDPVDVTHLARYMANWNGYENIDAKNSDVDESGSVTTIDNVILSRHIANWLGYDILPIK